MLNARDPSGFILLRRRAADARILSAMLRLALLLTALLLPALALAGDEAPKKPTKIDPSITAFVKRAQAAAAGTDDDALHALFDVNAMSSALEAAGYMNLVPADRRERLKRQAERGLIRAILEGRLVSAFDSFRVRTVTKGESEGARVLYLWLLDEVGGMVRARWYLQRNDASWKITDVEHLDIGVRVIPFMGMLILERVSGGLAPWMMHAPAFSRSYALLGEGKFAEALLLLKPLESVVFPDALAAILQTLLGLCEMTTGSFDAAMVHLDAAAELPGDTPIVHLMRGTIHNLEFRHGLALREMKRYEALLDADPESGLEMGIALHGLDRKAEALRVLTPAVRGAPKDPETLAYYALCLPAARRSELGKRFGSLDDPVLGHREIADIVLEKGAVALLRLFGGYLQAARPKHYDVLHYEGQALYLEKKYREAADRFEAGRDAMLAAPEGERPDDADTRQVYVDAVMDALLDARAPIEAYTRTPQKAHAFTYIGEELLWSMNADTMRSYLAHVRTDPPKMGADELRWRLAFYAAEADRFEGKDDAVVKAQRTLLPLLRAAVAEDDENESLESLLWDVEDRLLRALIRLKKFDDARPLAAEVSTRDEDHRYLVLIHLAHGKAAEAIALIERAVREGTDALDYFEDPDMREALAAPPFAALREKLLPK